MAGNTDALGADQFLIGQSERRPPKHVRHDVRVGNKLDRLHLRGPSGMSPRRILLMSSSKPSYIGPGLNALSSSRFSGGATCSSFGGPFRRALSTTSASCFANSS